MLLGSKNSTRCMALHSSGVIAREEPQFQPEINREHDEWRARGTVFQDQRVPSSKMINGRLRRRQIGGQIGDRHKVSWAQSELTANQPKEFMSVLCPSSVEFRCDSIVALQACLIFVFTTLEKHSLVNTEEGASL